MIEAQPSQPGLREHDGVQSAFESLIQASFDVATQPDDVQAGTQVKELRPASK